MPAADRARPAAAPPPADAPARRRAAARARDEAAHRAFDAVAAAVGLVLLAPLLAALALAVRATSPGPAFFRQTRVGRGGRPFRIHKLRTMRAGADREGGHLTVAGDPRVTRLGAWLRRTKLDELPQLIDVVRGDMALVGPRPEVPAYVARYTPAQRRVLDVRPGITDPASLRYRDEEAVLARAADPERAYVEEVLPHKLALNLAYQARRTLASDVGVVLATLARLAGGARARGGAPGGRPGGVGGPG